MRDMRFGPKVRQIGPKWDKPETFSYKISVNFDSPKCTKILSEKVPTTENDKLRSILYDLRTNNRNYDILMDTVH